MRTKQLRQKKQGENGYFLTKFVVESSALSMLGVVLERYVVIVIDVKRKLLGFVLMKACKKTTAREVN